MRYKEEDPLVVMALDEVKDGDLCLAPGEELLDNVPADKAAAANDEAAEKGSAR